LTLAPLLSKNWTISSSPLATALNKLMHLRSDSFEKDHCWLWLLMKWV
jgi:hypothetical protein